MTIVHSTEVNKNGKNPVLLLVYGAYGHALSLDYQLHKMALLNRGWVVRLFSFVQTNWLKWSAHASPDSIEILKCFTISQYHYMGTQLVQLLVRRLLCKLIQ